MLSFPTPWIPPGTSFRSLYASCQISSLQNCEDFGTQVGELACSTFTWSALDADASQSSCGRNCATKSANVPRGVRQTLAEGFPNGCVIARASLKRTTSAVSLCGAAGTQKTCAELRHRAGRDMATVG